MSSYLFWTAVDDENPERIFPFGILRLPIERELNERKIAMM
jgi:hypothetical protein